jgi:tetratricopeptide (TPR) repeat protein
LLYAVLTSVAVFVVFEGVLLLLGIQPGVATADPYVAFERGVPLFVERAGDDGRAILVTAENKRAYFNDQQFPKRKPLGTYRVFCMGGSTTYGRPYDDMTSFPGWLRELLPVADASRDWEVINAGGVSYASYRVVVLMEELAGYQPDLFVIYSGHNEFLEERTYREVRESPPALHRVSALLSHTRTYSLVQTLVKPSKSDPGPHKMPDEVDALLDHTVGPSAYHRDDRLRKQILENYRFNLVRMIEIARSAGADMLLVVPASNVKDASPFKSQHKDDLSEEQHAEWLQFFERGRSLQAAGRPDEALREYQRAAKIDDRFAELHYRMGQLLLEMRRLAEARIALERALDEDVCPLRVLPEIQEILRETAQEFSIPLVDAEDLLRNECLRRFGHNSPGREYFLDHVHPTIETNRLLAETMVERLIDESIIERRTSWSEESIEKVAARIEAKIDAEVQAVALRNLAKVLNWAGKHAEAGPLALRAVNLRARRRLPEDPEAFVLAAAHLKTTGDVDTAISYYQQALRHNPDYVEAHRLLGAAMVEQGRFDEAGVHFQEAARLEPDDAHAHHMAGAVLAELDRYSEAIEHYRRADRLTPSDAHIHFNMAFALEQLGKTDDAARWYRSTLKLNPDDAEARRNLELLNAREPSRNR